MQLFVTGHPLHTRSLTMALVLADEGRWHARGEIIDLRKTGFAAMPTSFQPAGLIHQMSIDLVVDPEMRRIESIVAEQPVVAVERSERSCGQSCRDPVDNLKALEGESLGDGFSKKLSLAFGRARGCSHLLTLFHFMASAVPQALDRERAQERAPGAERQVGERVFQRSFFLDGFHNEGEDIELAVQVGDFYLRPQSIAKDSLDRLELEHDVRLFARVQTPDQTLKELRISERERDADTVTSAAWHERPGWADGLTDVPLAVGFASRAMKSCGTNPQKRVLLDALLQLAPGHFQVLAALAEQWAGRSTSETGGPEGGGKPIGGMTANCYMWRSDGPFGEMMG